MVSDPREPMEDAALSCINFDNYTNAYRLIPFRGMKVDANSESTLSAYNITKMVVANYIMYAIGATASKTQVYVKVTGGGSESADPTSQWGPALGTSTSANSVESNIGLVLYHNYLYGVNTNGVWKYGDITSSKTFTYNDYTTYIPTAPGIVH